MHVMWTIAISVPGVCQSVTREGCANAAERIEILLSAETLGEQRNIELDRGRPDFRSNAFDAAFAKLLRPLVQHAREPTESPSRVAVNSSPSQLVRTLWGIS